MSEGRTITTFRHSVIDEGEPNAISGRVIGVRRSGSSRRAELSLADGLPSVGRKAAKTPSARAVGGGVMGDPVLDLQRRLGYAPPNRVLSAVLREIFPGRIAVVSSFGAEAAVLLHLVAAIDPATPVLFIDTGRHFAETLDYRDRLVAHLGLTGVRSVGPTPDEVARLDADSSRAIWDPDGCCAFRKVAPLQRALTGFDAWITGRKRFQSAARFDLPVFEGDGAHVKVNPLASWSAADIAAHVAAHRLPAHPLIAQGYHSIGCAPCTSVAAFGEDPRAGRWRGFEKTECGIHQSIPNPTGKQSSP